MKKSFKLFIKYIVVVYAASSLLLSCKNNITLNVTTASSSVKVGGYVKGLSGAEQVTLVLNGTETINVPSIAGTATGSDSFWFTTNLTTGENYNVELTGQTTTKTCSPGGNVGTAVSSNVTSVLVSCVASVAGVPGVTVFPVAALSTTESGSTVSFGIWLNAAPTDNVTIPITSSDLTEGTVSAASLIFTPANWNTPQIVTVTGVNDWTKDGNVVYSAQTGMTTSPTDLAYNGTFNPPDVTITNLDNDTSGVYITPATGLMVTETAGSAHTNTFTVVLTSAPLPFTTATISLSSSNVAEGTVLPASVVFDDTNWNIPQTVTITGVDDVIADGNQAFSIVTGNVVSLDPWYSAMVIPDVSFLNIDNETFGVTVLAGSSMQVSESGTTSSFEVVLNSQPTGNVTIGVNTTNALEGTILAPFVGAAGTLTFTNGNWNIPQTITVQGVADSIADGNQPFTIVLAAAASGDTNYNGINPVDVAFNNTDMDTAGLLVNKGVGSLATSETATTTSFSVVLQSKPTAPVTIDPTITDSTEGAFTVPFAGSTGTLTFTTGNWNIPQTVTVQGQDDLLADGNVSYNITFGSTVSADPVYSGTFTPAPITVMNIDNDTAGVTVGAGSSMLVSESGASSSFSVVLNSQPIANVTIATSTSNSFEGTITTPFVGAAGTLTFTSANWSTPQTVTVQGVPDFVADGNQTFFIVLAATASADPVYSGTINPPDVTYVNVDRNAAGVTVNTGANMLVSESQTTSVFTVVLNSQPSANVTIPVSTSNALEGTITTPFVGSAGTLTFTSANWNIQQFVTVKGVPDSIADGNQNFNIVTGITASADPIYSATINPADVSYTNADIDSAGVIVNKGTASLVTSETGTTTTFSVVLQSKPTANVTIDPTISDSTEGAFTAPFAGSTGTLTFTPANYNIPQTLTVQGVDDLVADANISYNITFAATVSTDANYNATFTPLPVAVINTDNETKGILVNIGNGLITAETGTTATIWVALNSQPTANVTVGNVGNITSSSSGVEINVAPATLTFTSVNWSTPQAVTLTGVDDFITDGMTTSTIAFGTSGSGDANYNGLAPASVNAYNMDNETGILPTVLALSTPMGGTVPAVSGSRYKITGLAPGSTYSFSASLLSGNVQLFVFSDPAFTTFVCSSTNLGLASENCIGSGSAAYYIVVQNITASSANFSVKVMPPLVNEGSVATPVGVTVGTPYNGQVAFSGSSYYSVPVTASTIYYAISLTGLTTDQNLDVYTNAAFTTLATPGSSINLGTTNENVTYATTAGQTVLYIKVTDAGALSGSFTISVTQNAPIAIAVGQDTGGLISPTQVAAGNIAYYTVPVLASTTYAVSMTNLLYNFNLYVYTDAAFTALAGSSLNGTTTSELVNYTTTAGQTMLYIKVVDANGTGSPSSNTFSLKVILGGVVDQGSVATPIVLALNVPFEGTASTSATGSFYQITGLAGGTPYFISARNLSGDVDLYVYNNAAFSAAVVCAPDNTIWSSNTPEDCTTSGSTAYYIKILDYAVTPAGSTYVLTVKTVASIVNQGTTGAPVGFALGSTYFGTVAPSGSSFYSVAVSANTNYTISLSGVTNDFDLYVYTIAGFPGYTGSGWVIRPYLSGTVNEVGNYTTGPAETMLYIAVNDFSGTGGLFSLKVQ
jgi:hypothetical protein